MDKKMKKRQNGYTLFELIIVLVAIGTIALGGTLLYVAWHFVSNAW
jgi:prepilin-type N-terminal cleavage/methylation domain-containing protein